MGAPLRGLPVPQHAGLITCTAGGVTLFTGWPLARPRERALEDFIQRVGGTARRAVTGHACLLFFCEAIVNSSYVGHAEAGDRSHREGSAPLTRPH